MARSMIFSTAICLCLFLPVATSGVDCGTESPGTCMDQSVLLQHHAKITIEDQKEEDQKEDQNEEPEVGTSMVEEGGDAMKEEKEEEQGEGKVGKQAKGLVQAVSGAGLLQEGHDAEGGTGRTRQQTELTKKQTRENEEPKVVDIEIGGISHRTNTELQSNGNEELQRPEFKVTERLTPDGVWEPCVPDDGTTVNSKKPTNCWKGQSRGKEDADLVASFKSKKYKILALEAMFKCDMGNKGGVFVTVRYLETAKLRIFANHRLIREIETDIRQKDTAISVDVLEGAEVNVGESVLVRVELVPKTNKVAKAKIKVAARSVLESFDKCMTAKLAHSDCLEELSGDGAREGVELRNSPKKLQLPCLQRSTLDCTSATNDVCDKWRCCLSEEHRAFLKDVIIAAGSQESQSQTVSMSQSPQVEADPEHNDCIDPRHSDPESWDCECYETWAAKCPDSETDRAACLTKAYCSVPEGVICPEWRTLNCEPASQTALVQRSITRINASKLDISAPLEESLTGKCASQ